MQGQHVQGRHPQGQHVGSERVSTLTPRQRVQGLSSVQATLSWGVLSSDNAVNAFGDPIAAIQPIPVVFEEEFDLRDIDVQRRVLGHLATLVDPVSGNPLPDRVDLVDGINVSPLFELAVFCNPALADTAGSAPILADDSGGMGAGENPDDFQCTDVDEGTQLPVGDAFAEALFVFLRSGRGIVRPPRLPSCDDGVWSSLLFVRR